MNFKPLFETSTSEFQQPLKDELWAATERKLMEGGQSQLTEARRYSLDELKAMPTLSQGQADNLKFDDGTTRVWLSRMTKADGAPYNNQVTVEVLRNGRWETSKEYQATRGRPSAASRTRSRNGNSKDDTSGEGMSDDYMKAAREKPFDMDAARALYKRDPLAESRVQEAAFRAGDDDDEETEYVIEVTGDHMASPDHSDWIQDKQDAIDLARKLTADYEARGEEVEIGLLVYKNNEYVDSLEFEDEMQGDPLAEARRGGTDIGDGFYIHDSGLDVNGNWRVTISKGANRAVGIQTNGSAPAAHHKSIAEIAADPRAAEQLKDFYMNFIYRKNRSRGGAQQRTLPAGSDDWNTDLREADEKATALQNRLTGLLDPQGLKAVVEPNTDRQAVVKPEGALEQAEEKAWADKVKAVLTAAKLKFQPQGTSYFIVDYPADLKESEEPAGKPPTPPAEDASMQDWSAYMGELKDWALARQKRERQGGMVESKLSEAPRKVSQADLEDMITRFNAEGSNFRLGGAYGYYELWTKLPGGRGEERLEVGSRKDIYEALVKYRFKFREARKK